MQPARTKRRGPECVPLVTPCCGRTPKLFGVADAFGGVHWCPCGMPWRMRDLVTEQAFELLRHRPPV